MGLETFTSYYEVTGVMILLDILSGIIKAFAVNGKLDSSKLRQGLYHKATYIIIIALATALEAYSEALNLGLGVPLVLCVCLYVIGTEIVSIIENVTEANNDLDGEKLREFFDVSGLLKKQNEANDKLEEVAENATNPEAENDTIVEEVAENATTSEEATK